MESLTKRLQPLLSGAVSLADLDQHTRQALDIYIHFRASAIIDSGDPEKIKAEIEAMPESVMELVRVECRRLYRRRFLEPNNISTPTGS